MNVMIFAAGLGTRLKPFTDLHPKALAPVADRPILARNLQKIKDIRSVKVDKVVVNIHHFPDQIRDYIASEDFGLKIEFSDETTLLLDTGGGLLKAAQMLTEDLADDTLLLINADIITDMPLDDIIMDFLSNGSDATLLCADRTSSRTLWFDADEKLVGWENLKSGETRPNGFTPTATCSQSPFCGIHVLKASTVLTALQQYADGSQPFSIIPFYLDQLASLTIKRHLLPSNYHWFDIGEPSKLAATSKFFLS